MVRVQGLRTPGKRWTLFTLIPFHLLYLFSLSSSSFIFIAATQPVSSLSSPQSHMITALQALRIKGFRGHKPSSWWISSVRDFFNIRENKRKPETLRQLAKCTDTNRRYKDRKVRGRRSNRRTEGEISKINITFFLPPDGLSIWAGSALFCCCLCYTYPVKCINNSLRIITVVRFWWYAPISKTTRCFLHT